MPQSATLPADNLDFAWDRIESETSLRDKLADISSTDWPKTASWLMREARVEQVWDFLSLRQIVDHFPRIKPFLGRRLSLWEYLIRTAHELGRL